MIIKNRKKNFTTLDIAQLYFHIWSAVLWTLISFKKAHKVVNTAYTANTAEFLAILVSNDAVTYGQIYNIPKHTRMTYNRCHVLMAALQTNERHRTRNFLQTRKSDDDGGGKIKEKNLKPPNDDIFFFKEIRRYKFVRAYIASKKKRL